MASSLRWFYCITLVFAIKKHNENKTAVVYCLCDGPMNLNWTEGVKESGEGQWENCFAFKIVYIHREDVISWQRMRETEPVEYAKKGKRLKE